MTESSNERPSQVRLGRPPKYGDLGNTREVHFRAPAGVIDELDAMCRQEGVSRSEFLTTLILHQLSQD